MSVSSASRDSRSGNAILSNTLSALNSAPFWKRMPQRRCRRASSSKLTRSRRSSNSHTCPSLGRCRPIISRSSVVLQLPELPAKPRILPRYTHRLMSRCTTVKIEGVLHEFSTIPGVTEDVTSIILNIKSLRLALHTDKPRTIRLRKKGPGEAKGSDIIHDADVTILTPDLHIATLDKDATLDIEMTMKHG